MKRFIAVFLYKCITFARNIYAAKMDVDIKNGITLKIEGELGKNKTLPIDALIKISESLQELIVSIARYDLPSNEVIDLNNFKIELSEFKPGSAIPSFVLAKEIHYTTNDAIRQREIVSEKFNALMSVADKGNYPELKAIYPEPDKRNKIVESLFDFTSSFGNSPFTLYETCKEDFKTYKPKKFKPEFKKELIGKIIELKQEKEEETVIGSIKITRSGERIKRDIQETYSKTQHSLSYSPEIINVRGRQYILHYPLRCLFEKEADYYVIENEQLDLIGTGLTQEEAEVNFNEEFDYLYARLNSLVDNQLSDRLLRIKRTLNDFVKEII
jgi:hypothetical protein